MTLMLSNLSKYVPRKALKFLALLPPLILVFYVFKYGANTPYFDEWDTPGIDFVNLANHDFSFRSLTTQHNEHRLFFPRILFIGLAQLFGSWNPRHQMFASLLVACGTYWHLYKLTDAMVSFKIYRLKWIGIFSIGLLVFSFTQRDSWLWGLQLATFIPTFAIATCISLAYFVPNSYLKYCLAVLICSVASFSFANGLLVWGVVFPVLLWSELRGHQRRLGAFLFAGAWGIAGLINIALYFRKYIDPPHHPGYFYALTHPLSTLAYVFAFLGRPIGKWLGLEGGIITGFFFVVLFGLVLGACYRRSQNWSDFLYKTLGWQTIAAYALITAAITALGRVGFGIGQALSGRYVVFSTPFYIAIVGLVLVLLDLLKTSTIATNKKPLFSTGLIYKMLAFSAFIFFSFYGLSNSSGLRWGYVTLLQRSHSKTCLMFSPQVVDETCFVERLHPLPDIVVQRSQVLTSAGMLQIPMVSSSSMAELSSQASKAQTLGRFKSLQAIAPLPGIPAQGVADEGTSFAAAGWALRSAADFQTDAVVLAYRDPQTQEDVAFKFAGVTPPFANRSLAREVNAAEAEGDRQQELVWRTEFAIAALPEETCTVSAWAFDTRRIKAQKLENEFSVCD